MGVRPNFAEDVYGEKAEKNTEFSESSLASRRSANLPKLKNVRDVHADVIISTHYDSSDAEKDLKFNYTDCDTLLNEFAELYTYSEMDEFAVNIALWKTVASKNTQIDSPYYFNPLPKSVKITVIRDLQSRMESAEQNVRLNAARVVLYLLQGSVLDFVEVPLLDRNIENVKQDNGNSGYEEECVMQSVRNAYLCSEYGIFQSLCTLLVVEMDEKFDQSPDEGRPCSKASSRDSRSVSNADLYSARSKKAATLADNESLRVIMSCLYHMVEGIRNLEMAESLQSEIPNVMKLRSDFLKLMEEPVETVNLPLLYILFNMLKPFYLSESPHYPIRKIVLLLWKILLATLGGWDQLRVMKEEKRKKLNLPIMEDTLSVAASLPSMPIQESDLALLASRRAGNAARAGMMARQFACNDDPTLSDDERDSAFDDWKSDSSSSSSTSEPQTPTPDAPEPENRHPASQTSGDRTPRVGTPVKLEPPKKQLVWKSKISQSGIEEFVQNGRIRHLDFKFAEKDATTLLGLPPSFAKSVDLLKKNLYTSVSEIQKEKDEDYNRYLFSMKEEIEQTKAEILYQEVLPNLGDYLVGLMKVLLAAVPSNKAKSDALNILIDVLTPETEGSDILSNSISLDHSASPLEDSVKLAIDINRHKEVLVKAASASLLLLTKHFKLNHIYQFEFVCQQVVYGNGIPLLLKHLDQDLVRFVQSRYEIHAYNYPQCLLHYVRNGDEWPSLNAENVEEARCGEYFMWRNVFSVINIIRFLNKVVKGHQSRVMMLIAYKSAPVLKRSLKIRLPLFQFYVLKAIKMQSRYLGRQWRKSNMDVISAIYSRVRHRIMDDWAFANVVRRQCDYQVEESQLKFAVERFHNRRYSKFHHQYAIEVDDRPMPGDNYLNRVDLRDFKPCEKSMAEVLNVHAELSDEFKKNYEAWMDREVIRSKINWDEFLSPNADEII